MSSTAAIAITVAIRYLLVMLFFPFSALDKILNFRGAVAQAMQVVPSAGPARALIIAGLGIEIVMPLAILTGVGDRVAAVILAGYCGVTALLWKPFWRPGDFWHPGKSEARDLFWDFLKNFSLAGGFLLITFGATASEVSQLLAHPSPATQAYSAPADPAVARGALAQGARAGAALARGGPAVGAALARGRSASEAPAREATARTSHDPR